MAADAGSAPPDTTPPAKTWAEWATTTVNGLTALVGAIAALVAAITGIYNLLPSKKSTICHFTAGFLAGKYRDYAPQPPLDVGSQCQDNGSTGFVVEKTSDIIIDRPKTTLKCKFSNGPLAGKIIDYNGVTDAKPTEVGSSCTDGVSSAGIAVE